MTLIEKITKLSPELREKLDAIKDVAGLDAFLHETGLELADGEKAQALEYFDTGKLPLSDEELDNVAGGGCEGDYRNNMQDAAFADGRRYHLISAAPEGGDYNCEYCRQSTVYARNMSVRPTDNNGVLNIYTDCKCYHMSCLRNSNELTTTYHFKIRYPFPLGN